MDTVTLERRQLLNLAYRLLGSLTEAEDAVQEAYARWYALTPQEQDAIRNPGAWLTTVTSRICLDQLGSARVRRESYVGEWLPEPLPDSPDPADRITLDESVGMAFMVVLDAMTPAERVAFVLHDVFRYSFDEVGEIVGRTPAACRQLASTGRRRLPTTPKATPARRTGLVRDFKQAWEAKDIKGLIGLLDPEARAVADGGGLVNTVMRPVVGSAHIAGYAVQIADWVPGLEILERTVNGQPGLVAQRGDHLIAVIAFDIADDRITRLWAIRNPEKLRLWEVQ